MMESRRMPSATPSQIPWPASSGPRWSRLSVIASNPARLMVDRPAMLATPAMPHISRYRPVRPETPRAGSAGGSPPETARSQQDCQALQTAAAGLGARAGFGAALQPAGTGPAVLRGWCPVGRASELPTGAEADHCRAGCRFPAMLLARTRENGELPG